MQGTGFRIQGRTPTHPPARMQDAGFRMQGHEPTGETADLADGRRWPSALPPRCEMQDTKYEMRHGVIPTERDLRANGGIYGVGFGSAYPRKCSCLLGVSRGNAGELIPASGGVVNNGRPGGDNIRLAVGENRGVTCRLTVRIEPDGDGGRLSPRKE